MHRTGRSISAFRPTTRGRSRPRPATPAFRWRWARSSPANCGPRPPTARCGSNSPGLIKSMKEDHQARVVELMTDGDQSELTASNGRREVKLIEDAPASSDKPSEKSEPMKK